MRSHSIFKSTIILILIFFSLILFLETKVSFAAKKGTVKGVVTDKKSKTPLPGITITVEGTDIIGFTDEKGNYSLDLPEGTYTVRAELLGYKTAEAKGVVVLPEETNTINFAMEEIEAIKGEEVVVTGERMDVPLSRTTASVSVVSSQQTKDLAVAGNASDLLAYTPGVQMEGGGTGAAKTIKIRGATIAPPKVATAGILLLVDGIPMNDPISGYASVYMIPAENIERVEVLKGASSAQYGGQAAAGVINIITKKGQKMQPRTSFDMSFGTYQHRAHAETEYIQNYSFSHSWGGEIFDYSVSGAYSFSSGYTTAETANVGKVYRDFARKFPGKGRISTPDVPVARASGAKDSIGAKIFPDRIEIPFMLGREVNEIMDVGNHDQTERYSVNVNLGVKPFKNNTFRISSGYSFLDFTTVFTPDVAAIGDIGDFYQQAFLRVLNKRDYVNAIDEWKITPKLTYKLRFGAQKTTAGGIFIFVKDYIDYSVAEEAKGKKDRFDNDDPNSPFQPTPGTEIGRNWSIANELSYDFDLLGGNTATIGQEYQWNKLYAPKSLNAGDQIYTKINLTRAGSSLYFQDMQKFGKFTFSVGGRWDQWTHFIDDISDEFSPRVGINYELSPGTSFRASVGRARRFPEFARTNGLAQTGGVLFGNTREGPEISWTYELGFRFLTKYLAADIAYFYNDYSDFEIPVPLNIGNEADAILGLTDPAAIAKAKAKYNRIYNYVKTYYPYAMPNKADMPSNFAIPFAKVYTLQMLGLIPKDKKPDFSNLPVAKLPTRTYDNPAAGFFTNGPDVVYQGIDASVDLFPMKQWNINLSYLFTRAVVGNANPFDFSQGTPMGVLVPPFTHKGIGPEFHGGNRLIYVPTHVFKISSNYTLPFGLRAIASARFKSRALTISRYAVGGVFDMPEHWIADLKFIQPFFNDKMKLSFSIENVFSKKYFEDGIIPSAVARYDVGLSFSF